MRLVPISVNSELDVRGITADNIPPPWKGNDHWMLRYGVSLPTHDPRGGCESCGYVDDDGGVEATDLIWVTDAAWSVGIGQWLCMECD